MQQNPNPKMPEMGKKINNNSEVTLKELVYQLENRSAKAIMLSNKKKDFLKLLLKNKKLLVEYCNMFDGIMNTTLSPSIKQLLPSNDRQVDKSVNAELAVVVAKLLPPLRILRSQIVFHYKTEALRKGNLRTSTKEKQHRTSLLLVLDDAYDTLTKLESAIFKNRSNSSVNTVCKPIKLTDQQQERNWSEDHIPTQKYLRECVMCGHTSTNWPPENDAIADFNRAKELEYQSKLKKWEKYQGELANGKLNAKAPDGMKKRPYRRDFKEPIIMCMCSTSYCLGAFDTATSSCPIKCLKPALNSKTNISIVKTEPNLSGTENSRDVIQSKTQANRYPFEGTPKRCTCPICACRCSFACYVSEVPKIMLQKKIENNTDLQASDYASSSPGFLGKILGESIKVGWSTMNCECGSMCMPKYNNSFDKKIESYIENRGVTAACEVAATNIACKATSLPMEEKIAYRDLIGKPNTKCILPSGDMFDTKILIGGSDKHAKNNKLGSTAISSNDDIEVISFKPQPGMRTNLQIDWSKQSNAFKDFMDMKSSKNGIQNTTETKVASKPPVCIDRALSYDPSVEVIENMVKQEDITKPKAKTCNDLASLMYTRIVKKSKNKLTKAISERMADRSNDETKAKVKEIKNVVLTLESSHNNESNISIIKSVTNDGCDLIDDIYPVSSDEVLERVRVYHDV